VVERRPRRRSSMVDCHIANGDVATGSCVIRGGGDGCYAAYLDVVSREGGCGLSLVLNIVLCISEVG